LAQINSANFRALGTDVESVFEPCFNLGLASTILQRSYDIATRSYDGIDAISATYSLYNTGTLTRGFRNGYVGRVWSAAAELGSIPSVPANPAALPHPANNGWQASPDAWVIGSVKTDGIEVFK
jgi:type IV secretion system protein VirB1